MQFHHLLKLRGKKAVPVFILLLFLIACPLGYGCSPQDEPPAGTVVIEGDAVAGRTFFTLEELKAWEEALVEADYFSLNSYGTKQYFHFKGIWVGYVLQEKVDLRDRASKVTFIAEDGYQVEYELADVLRDDYIDEKNPGAKYKMILAWEEDGRRYDTKKGNPFRLVVGQKEPGDVNKPYWVNNIKTIRVD